jgi:hypothetical protein
VGALLISPFVHAGTKVSESFNDFSLLKSLARLFGVLPLGHANDPGAVSFGATVYSTTEKAAQAAPQARGHRSPINTPFGARGGIDDRPAPHAGG